MYDINGVDGAAVCRKWKRKWIFPTCTVGWFYVFYCSHSFVSLSQPECVGILMSFAHSSWTKKEQKTVKVCSLQFAFLFFSFSIYRNGIHLSWNDFQYQILKKWHFVAFRNVFSTRHRLFRHIAKIIIITTETTLNIVLFMSWCIFACIEWTFFSFWGFTTIHSVNTIISTQYLQRRRCRSDVFEYFTNCTEQLKTGFGWSSSNMNGNVLDPTDFR